MCGLAGFVSRALAPGVRESAVDRMLAQQRHRGPDDVGRITRHEATLGLQRLAVFDPERGQQPMSTVDGRFTLVFNGAIYNFRELREELATREHRFASACDTEVLLAAWTEWQADCLPRLRGMFAFAIWDDHARQLSLARDPFGIKPLYVHAAADRVVFASELRALLASRAVDAAIDPASLDAYLAYLAVPAPRTVYRDVVNLRPGELLTWTDGATVSRRWWRFPQTASAATPARDRTEFVRELRHRLEDTLAAHRLADVPVGAFVSGGLDSAAVVGLMSRLSGERLKTFSIGFVESDYSEAVAAEATAVHYGTDHHTTIVTGPMVTAELDRFIAALDQPTGDGLNTYFVSREARAGGVTVALSGLGGDELFGGYSHFQRTPRLARWLELWRRLPVSLRRPILCWLERGDTRRRKLADVLRSARSIHDVAAQQRLVLNESTRRQLLVQPSRGELLAVGEELPSELEGCSPEEIVSGWELRTYLSDVLLRDSDVMSMRHSLELRVPFVDRPLIEWLWAQPSEFKFDSRRSKSALRDAVADLLPPDVASRRKWGFTLPFAVWMRNELRPFLNHTFSARSVAQSGWLDVAAVQGLWQRYLQGNDSREWSRVWSVAVLIAFLNRASTG
ncbi:MAG TPA: asparagine synthase (glutamine-hydrolyzing) [Candidatus Synoicihabitans sp.]|nr:asparagine synthase (glutamine-hydrolyzing) [Candidatus Synoicihabitans sp.]